MFEIRQNSAAYLAKLTKVLAALDRNSIDKGVSMIVDAWERGAQVITLGNGGSAMTALHYVTDWGKMFHLRAGRPLNARSLVDNMGLMTAYANDISYNDVISEQLKNVMREGDLIVAISGSGNSENVIRAVEYANANGAATLGLCGYGGGRLKEKATHAVWAAVDDMQLSEDIHAIFGHIVMQAICE